MRLVSPTPFLRHGWGALVGAARTAWGSAWKSTFLALEATARRLYREVASRAQAIADAGHQFSSAARHQLQIHVVSRAASWLDAPGRGFGDFGRTRDRRLLGAVFVTDSLLAAGLVVLLTLTTVRWISTMPRLMPGARPAAQHAIRAAAMGRLDAPLAALPSPTPTPLPTATSTPTPAPALTATPIPISLIVWQPTLPQEGGWSGAASCSGTYYAPVGSGAFVWPTDDHYLSGKNYNALWHPGLDLSAWYGEPVYAADAGVTVYAGWNAWGYGNMVVVDHGNGWHTLYGHLSQVSVSCAQSVERGGVIGLAGSTGRSTGPHLHFEMRHDTWGRVNPWHYLP